MSYTNELGSNPKKFSSDIEIRSGTSVTAEAVSDEYRDTLDYEPGVGTMYLSTGGIAFIHHKAGTQANDWSLVTDVQQPDIETFTASLNLATTALTPIFLVGKNIEVTPTLTAGITKSITNTLEATASLGASVLTYVSSLTVPGALSLSASVLTVFTDRHKIVDKTITLTPTLNKSMVITAKEATATLSSDVSISVDPA